MKKRQTFVCRFFAVREMYLYAGKEESAVALDLKTVYNVIKC